MKTICRCIRAFVCAVLPLALASVLQAQAPPAAVSGQWQGTTDGPEHVRVVVLLPAASAGRAIVYLLDGRNSGRPYATTTLQLSGEHLAFAVANIEAAFNGSFAADHASIAGTWTHHGASAPLKLIRAQGGAAWELPENDAMMPVDADPSFDVATIRPADPNIHSSGIQIDGRRVIAHNQTMQTIVCFAYGIHRAQLVDAPSWFSSDRWEINGVADIPGSPNLMQMRGMFRKLLAERLGMRIDRQTRELSVYALVKGKDAPKITPSANGGVLPDSTGNGNNGVREFRYSNISMEEFAGELAFFEDRPFVNQTGLPGRYDFRLRWSTADAPSTDANTPPALFTAIQEQLGLKVESQHAPVPVFVIRHVDRPSDN